MKQENNIRKRKAGKVEGRVTLRTQKEKNCKGMKRKDGKRDRKCKNKGLKHNHKR